MPKLFLKYEIVLLYAIKPVHFARRFQDGNIYEEKLSQTRSAPTRFRLLVAPRVFGKLKRTLTIRLKRLPRRIHPGRSSHSLSVRHSGTGEQLQIDTKDETYQETTYIRTSHHTSAERFPWHTIAPPAEPACCDG